MKAALHGSYIEFVIYTGVTERYPQWFDKLLEEFTYTDESRFTFWVFKEERRPDYYEKQLVEEHSVFVRKPNGEVHITDYDTFHNLYITFFSNSFTNSGIAAYEEDCIEYVECKPGVLDLGYPSWFYEYYTEAINLPNNIDGFMLLTKNDSVMVTEHCVTLRNKFGEIRTIPYSSFIKYYDDKRLEFLEYQMDNRESYLR